MSKEMQLSDGLTIRTGQGPIDNINRHNFSALDRQSLWLPPFEQLEKRAFALVFKKLSLKFGQTSIGQSGHYLLASHSLNLGHKPVRGYRHKPRYFIMNSCTCQEPKYFEEVEASSSPGW